MGQASSFDRDLDRLRRVSADLFKAMDAAEASFLDHARSGATLAAVNFPLEEGVFEETQRLLIDWQGQAAGLILALDAAGERERLSYERLFDKDAGLHDKGLVQRSMPRRNVPAETIVANLLSALAALSGLGKMVQEAKRVLSRHHRQCEFHLLQLVERRRQADTAIDEANRQIMDLKGWLQAHMRSDASLHSAAALAASEEDRRHISAELQSVESREEIYLSERETLLRLIGDIGALVDGLNAEIGVANVMAAKTTVDAEQGVALLKAVLDVSGPPLASVPEPVSEMLAAFEANPLSGLGLYQRRQSADAAFRRRMSSSSLAEAVSEEEEGAVQAESADQPQ